MLHEIGVEIGAALAAKGCPFKVIDGPEPTKTTTFARERVVIEPDADDFKAARGARQNPKQRLIRGVGAKITIYAQSPATGAQLWEHRRRADHVLDLVLVALDSSLIARRNGYALKSGRFVPPEDLAKSEVAGGVAYELTFSLERAVNAQTWAGDKRPEASPLFSHTGGVSIAGSSATEDCC